MEQVKDIPFRQIRACVMVFGFSIFFVGAIGILLNFAFQQFHIRPDLGIGLILMGLTFFFMGMASSDPEARNKNASEDKISEELHRLKDGTNERSASLNGQCSGGVSFDRSSCCGANVTYTEGGVRIPICSRCGMTHQEPRY